jgi:hypothetical protein
MQSIRLIEVLNRICNDLQLSALVNCLSPIINRQNAQFHDLKKHFNELVFKARDGLAFLSRDPDADLILNELGIKAALDSQAIGRLVYILQSKASIDQVWGNAVEMMDIQAFYATLVATLRLQGTMSVSVEKARMLGLQKDESVVELELLPIDPNGFKIQRLEAILPLIDDLFKQLCTIYGQPEESPKILYMDSGSGIIIGLKGTGKIIDALRNLFLSIWEKIRFRKQDDIEKNLEVIDSSLDVLEKIKNGQSSGSLSNEDAFRLKHLVVKDVLGLLENGASLRELQKPEFVENRKLLTDMATVKFLSDKPKTEVKVIDNTLNDTPPASTGI